MTAVIHCGDVRDVLATLPAGSVQTCVTSPPYFSLRDYGTATWDGGDAACDHVSGMARSDTDRETPGGRGGSFQGGQVQYRGVCGKCGATRIDRQIGLEATVDDYLAVMVDVFRGVRRVLRDDGTVWCNIADSYAPDKNLRLVPERLAIALQADGWIVRSEILWCKPNPMPESVQDRPTVAHEHIWLLTKQARYYYDSDAIREDAKYGRRDWTNADSVYRRASNLANVASKAGLESGTVSGGDPEAGRNARTVWDIATSGFSEAHFATFPLEIPRRCILAGTSEKGCCGAMVKKLRLRGDLTEDQRARVYARLGAKGLV